MLASSSRAHGARYDRRLLITGPAPYLMDGHDRNRHAIRNIDTLDTHQRSVRYAHDLSHVGIKQSCGARSFASGQSRARCDALPISASLLSRRVVRFTAGISERRDTRCRTGAR